MAIDTHTSVTTTIAAVPVPLGERTECGLLLTESPALARAFRRELRNCVDCAPAFDVFPSLQDALVAGARYAWIAVDLDAMLAPSEAIRQARVSWPAARLAVLSCWWSERDVIARETADVVLHKPVRSAELLALLRADSPAAGARTPGKAV